MKIPLACSLAWFVLAAAFAGTTLSSEEVATENEVASIVSRAETIVKASAPHSLTVVVRNTHGGTSPLMIEIRDGGCEGKMIARFPLRSNDSVTYSCTADFVRIVADDPATSKYSYDVSFQKSERKPLSHSFDATGKHTLNMSVFNTNAAMTMPVVVNSSTNDGTANRKISIDPKVQAYWNEPADLVKIEVGEGANASFSYTVKFTSR
jgi:hypothetical protein